VDWRSLLSSFRSGRLKGCALLERKAAPAQSLKAYDPSTDSGFNASPPPCAADHKGRRPTFVGQSCLIIDSIVTVEIVVVFHGFLKV